MTILPVSLEITVVLLGIFLLLLEAFADEKKDKSHLPTLGIAGLCGVLIASFFASPAGMAPSAFYLADSQAMFFKQIALVSTIVVLVMGAEYTRVLRRYIYGTTSEAGLGEFFALPVLTCAGLMWMASAVDFVVIFVALELVTISFYILVTYMRRNRLSLEAGVKYLILGALSTGFLVYGITWVFGVTGETSLPLIEAKVSALATAPPALLFGFGLILIALCFKIAAAPFQFWVPDVYQGAPTPVTAFLSVASKAAGFIVLIRVVGAFRNLPGLWDGAVLPLFVILAAATLLYGNLAAIPQYNLKRLLAYSSISHAGFLLIGVATLNGQAIGFYLWAYLLMTLLSFLVIVVVSAAADPGETGDDIREFNGLGRRSPFLAFAMLISMLSLAGVPLTAGFFGKFLIFTEAVRQHQYVLLLIGVIAVAAGFYYYLKVVKAMYWEQPKTTDAIPVAPLTRIVMALLIFLIIAFGVYPQPVLDHFNGVTSAKSAALSVPSAPVKLAATAVVP